MGMFSSIEDQNLVEARKQVVESDQVCPSCKAPFRATGATLTAFSAPLGIEGHKCPSCGYVLSFRRPSPDGL